MEATPTTNIADTRMPAMMTGQARGSCTRSNTCVGVSPIPLAASRTLESIPSSPAMVLRRMGSKEYKSKARKEGAKPNPTRGMKMVKRASEGIVKKTEEIARESSRASGLRLVTTPKTMAKTLATPRTLTTYTLCSIRPIWTWSQRVETKPHQLLKNSIRSPFRCANTGGQWPPVFTIELAGNKAFLNEVVVGDDRGVLPFSRN